MSSVIVINLIGNNLQGTGHVYRMLRLTSSCSSYNIINKNYKKYDLYFVIKNTEVLAHNILKKNNIDYIIYNVNDEFYKILDNIKPDIIINDCLNTDIDFIKKQKLYTKKIINFEDYGKGTLYADLVINSFYNKDILSGDKVKYGLKYTLLSPLLSKSSYSVFNEKPKKLILTFGGSDPSNIIESVLNKLINNKINKKIHILIILGIGYNNKKKIVEYIENTQNISISIDEQNMIGQIQSSDIAITSCGCAMFECCYFLVPTICIAHNNREVLHTSLCRDNTIINLGLFKELDEMLLIKQLNLLIDSTIKRKNIRKNMLSMHNDIKYSYNNVFDLIFK